MSDNDAGLSIIYKGGYVPDLAICIDPTDRFYGWLLARNPLDGQWVSLAKMDANATNLHEARARIVELEAKLAAERERREAAEAALAAERERREAAEAELAAKRGRREAAEVILREMAKLYAGQIDNTGNYCNQLHDSARAHFARYEKEPT